MPNECRPGLRSRSGGRGTITALALAGACAISFAAHAATPAEAAQAQWASQCGDWDEWDKAGPPFKIYGNTWYVGTCGISAILVTGSEGHVLIDGGPVSAAPAIADNIEALGFRLADVKLLLHSHEHNDHVGGLAELERRTGARLLASPAAAAVLASGAAAASDPQYGAIGDFPPARVDGAVHDGQVVELGDLALTALATPGHTAGALSWQWTSCENDDCKAIVYADSLSAVSRDGYRFSDHPALVAGFRSSLERIAGLDCTILLTPHPSAGGMRARLLEGALSGEPGCRAYAAGNERRLEERLAQEGG